MKTAISILLLTVHISSVSYGLNDFERGILFVANTFSYGTLLPEIEGQIAKKKLEYEKRKAEFKQQLEKDRRVFLKTTISNELVRLNEHKTFLLEQQTRVGDKLKAFSKVVKISTEFFQGLLTKEQLIAEIEIRNKNDAELAKDWENLMMDSGAGKSLTGVNSDDSERLLITALDIESTFESLQSSLQMQIDDTDYEISSMKTMLESL